LHAFQRPQEQAIANTANLADAESQLITSASVLEGLGFSTLATEGTATLVGRAD
jgi:hypothetical protein